MAHPTFGVSSQTKRNLKTFQFVEKPATSNAHSHMEEAQKENFPIDNSGGRRTTEEIETITKQSTDEAASITSHPATPAMRIPLADLIANTEDVFNRQPAKDTTPDDRILWQHGPTSSEPTSFGTPAPRGKKRARSSSPASQNDTSSHLPTNESFDLQPLSKHLKTPQNDPADELWARYAGGNMKNGDNPHPAFAHLLSSPQTPGTRRDAIRLQRSASLGMEWPMSKAKRRRLETGDSIDKVKDKFAKARSDLLEPSKSKDSRVKILVDKIAEGLNRGPRLDPDAPSSSSPLPERNSNEERSPESPTRNKGAGNVEQQIRGPSVDVPDQDSEKTLESETVRADEGSSEYGDADFDMDLLEAVERGEALENVAGVETVAGENPVEQHPGVEVGGGPLGMVPAYPVAMTDANPPLGKGVSNGSFDEFDDDDDEFVADLKELAAKFDSQHQQPEIKVEQDHKQGHMVTSERSFQAQLPPEGGMTGNGLGIAVPELEFDSDDEFGDGEVDFESLVALENAEMGQGNMAGFPSPSHVRFQS
jgi:DNA replication ATP-dependent helicase Dna2